MEHLKLFVSRINIPKVGYPASYRDIRVVIGKPGHQSYGESTSLARACFPLHKIRRICKRPPWFSRVPA